MLAVFPHKSTRPRTQLSFELGVVTDDGCRHLSVVAVSAFL
jgi:hypothetical protein